VIAHVESTGIMDKSITWVELLNQPFLLVLFAVLVMLVVVLGVLLRTLKEAP
jgi:hypothetical protein